MADDSLDIIQWADTYRELKEELKTCDNIDILKALHYTQTTTLKNEIIQLAKSEEKKSFERQIEKEEVYGFIKCLRKDLKQLREAMKLYQKNPEHFKRVQPITESIDTKLTDFKERKIVSFDKLMDEEQGLSNELEAFNSTIDDYEEPSQVRDIVANLEFRIKTQKSAQPRVIHTKSGTKSLTEMEDNNRGDNNEEQSKEAINAKLAKIKREIDEIEKSLMKEGQGGMGWRLEDHKKFLKIRVKYKNSPDSPQFIAECIEEMGYFVEAEIEQHIEIVDRITELENKKKELVSQYKAIKSTQNQIIVEIEKKTQELQELRKQEKLLSLIGTKEEREKRKEDIKKWKENRFASKMTEKENLEAAELAKKLERDAKFESRRLEVKTKVEIFRTLTKDRDEDRKQEEEFKKTMQKKVFSKEEIIRVKEREEDLMKKNFDKLFRKKLQVYQQQTHSEKVLSQVPNKYEGVESKLTEITAANAAKQREKYDPRINLPKLADNYAGIHVRTVGKRIPTWKAQI